MENSFKLGLSIVVENENKIIGFMKACTSEFRALAHVLTNTTIMIHPDYQSKGYGSQMVKKYCSLIENKLKYIYRFELLPHESNHKSISFYLKNGFKAEASSVKRVFNYKENFEDEVRPCLV